jgi:hypothetical protein
VIQITLNFKSVEAARAALLDIPTSALVGGPAPEKAEAPKSVKPAATQAAPVTVTKTEKATAPVAPAAESPSDPKPEPEATTSSAKPSASVDYPTLQKAVFALAGKSREAAGAVAASFSVKTFKELPEAKWADALVAVNAALAEAA